MGHRVNAASWHVDPTASFLAERAGSVAPYVPPEERKPTRPTWTEARVETLKELWIEGLSCAQIARHLGGITRNAVIGKVSRLGLPGRATPSAPRRRIGAYRSSSPAPRHALRLVGATLPPPAPLPLSPIETSAVIEQLQDHMCKWPVTGVGGTHFCGAQKTRGSYCAKHANDAYLGRPRRRRSVHAGNDDKLASWLAAARQWG